MFPHSRYAQRQSLLPPLLEDRLLACLSRAGGVVLLGLVAALWISLLTWSANDPSLTNVIDAVAQNALGSVGAIISDLLLQTVGLATVFVLVAPMFWGVEMLLYRSVATFRGKLACYPISVLVLAGALSALPSLQSWPLHHGLGGILGDGVFTAVANLMALGAPDFAGAVAGLILFAVGGAAIVFTLGLEWADFYIDRKFRRPNSQFSGRNETTEESVAAEPFVGSDHHTPQTKSWAPVLPPLQAQNAAPVSAHASGSTLYPDLQVPVQSNYRSTSLPHSGEDQRLQVHTTDDERNSLFEPLSEQPIGHQPSQQSHMPPPVPEVPPAPPGYESTRIAPMPGQQIKSDQVRPHTAGKLDAAPIIAALENDDDDGDHSGKSIARRFAPKREAREQVKTQHESTPVRQKVPALLSGLKFSGNAGQKFKGPSLNLLKRQSTGKTAVAKAALRGSARLLEDVLSDFGIKGEIKDIRPGPVVTLFEFEPARGIKSSRIIGLADDIARSMSATSARVAVIPGRNAIGIELPNAARESVALRGVLESDAFKSIDGALPLALGRSISGDPVVTDLARMPHLLVAGTTGSGKSVGINAMILSLLYRQSPNRCRLLMIDPKMLELSVYNDIPHLLTPVVTDPHKAVSALHWVVGEMEERYKRMSKLAVRNIEVYNTRVGNAEKRNARVSKTIQTGFDPKTDQPVYESESLTLEPMPYIVVVVDEFADLMAVAGKEIEGAVQRLAQMARAAGIHLIMATQRPSVDIITGTIKANFPTRISFRVTSKIDSRTILNEQGAEQLLGQGDMLFASGGGHTMRVHGPFVSDEEVEAIAEALRAQGKPQYVPGVGDGGPSDNSANSAGVVGIKKSQDDLYDRAVALVVRDQKASTSYVQRRLSIGYNRAADLIERMESEGVIGPAGRGGKREILAQGEVDA